MSLGSASESLSVEGTSDVDEAIEPSGIVLLIFFAINIRTMRTARKTKRRVISSVLMAVVMLKLMWWLLIRGEKALAGLRSWINKGQAA